MSAERCARLILVALLLSGLTATGAAWWTARPQGIEIHARMPQDGGWSPTNLTARLGEPLRLRLISDDVLHGFALGQSDLPAVDVEPGKVTEVTLTFDRRGKYVFYCTRWCGPDHWRMRGVIEVSDGSTELAEVGPVVDETPLPPLYVQLGMDLDAPRSAENLPTATPSALRGAALASMLPQSTDYRSPEYYRSHSPAAAWLDLRAEPALAALSAEQIWDLVAYLWQGHTTPEALAEGQRLYAANCAACHGEGGAGDGVFADDLAAAGEMPPAGTMLGDGRARPTGSQTVAPADFGDAARLLSASPALLQGKILRGGMGSGMPYWGPIFSEEQTWAIVAFLYTFQFEEVR